MDTASERSPELMEHSLYIHVKEFNNLFLNVVMLCLVS